ncbi:MAG: hypothetical protein PHP64_03610 [Actinomycetota bacterium]|nr:hypothetical protein [Actinomycetota bacterium]
MVWIYLIICLCPVFLTVLVLVAIGAGGVKVYRAGKRMGIYLKPHFTQMKESAEQIQKRGTDIANRGEELAGVIEEIGGRWNFIRDYWKDLTTSPISKTSGLVSRILKRTH